jgi:hypothetical protein
MLRLESWGAAALLRVSRTLGLEPTGRALTSGRRARLHDSMRDECCRRKMVNGIAGVAMAVYPGVSHPTLARGTA